MQDMQRKTPRGEEREGGRVSVEEGQVGEVEAPPASDRQVDVD